MNPTKNRISDRLSRADDYVFIMLAIFAVNFIHDFIQLFIPIPLTSLLIGIILLIAIKQGIYLYALHKDIYY